MKLSPGVVVAVGALPGGGFYLLIHTDANRLVPVPAAAVVIDDAEPDAWQWAEPANIQGARPRSRHHEEICVSPKHTTPHPAVPGGFVQHVSLVRTSKGTPATEWSCVHCGCPHAWADDPAHPGYGFIYATEARHCPRSFETPCPDCGRCYECAPDCPGMAAILAGSLGPDVVVAGSRPTPGES